MNNFRIFYKSSHSFEGQLPDEKTLRVLRMHWFVIVMRGVVLFLAALPLIGLLFVGDYFFAGESLKFVWFVTAVGFAFWWYWLFYLMTMYFLNTYIITDHRLIVSKQLGFFRRNLVELNVAKIQDISVEVEGFFETLLSFGNIQVQSAGAESKFRMDNIADPLEVKELINKASNKYLQMHPDKLEHK